MIQKAHEDLHIIVQDSPDPPRLLVVRKTTLRAFMMMIPLLVVGLALALVAALWWRTASQTTMHLPTMPSLTHSGDKEHELQQELKALQATVSSLQNKLTTPASDNATSEWWGPVKKPYASEDLSTKQLLRLENLVLENKVGAAQLIRFNLVNNTPSADRVTGHIFVLQMHANGMGIYPAVKAAELAQGLRFDQGESFAVSRLRPVEATFPASEGAHFMILIFTREGDMLMRKDLVPPFNREAP